MKHKESYAVFGQISISFARLEEIIQDILISIVIGEHGNEFMGIMLFEKLNIQSKLTLLKTIAETIDNNEELKKIVKQSVKLKEIRNQLTHGVWTIHKEDVIEVTRKSVKFKELLTTSHEWSSETKKVFFKNKEWSMLQRKFYKLNDLKIILEELNNLIVDATKFRDDITDPFNQ